MRESWQPGTCIESAFVADNRDKPNLPGSPAKHSVRSLNSYVSVRLHFNISDYLVITLSREDVNDCFTALGWTPDGRRARGRPKTTWEKTAEKEMNTSGWKSWHATKAAAQKQTVLG